MIPQFRYHFVLFYTFCLLLTTQAQNINTIAGTGIQGYSGDGGPAVSAKLNLPSFTVFDSYGNLYFSDTQNNCVRKIGLSGTITTIAGTGVPGLSGDGGSASLAQLNNPCGLAFDNLGNLYIADEVNNRIRKVDNSGVISTFAGTTGGFSGDGGLATSAQFFNPVSICFDPTGNLLVSDLYNYRVRKISPSGIVSTIAGVGTPGFFGDGGSATLAKFGSVMGIALDISGNIYLSDCNNNRIRMINNTGIINTVIGTGVAGSAGDGGSGALAELYCPYGPVFDASGNMYISDVLNHKIRKVNTSGIINTVAGTGTQGFSGDGGLATLAQLYQPLACAFDLAGNLYIGDSRNNRIRTFCSQTSCVTGIEFFHEITVDIYFYPNPNSGQFKLQMDNNNENRELILYNSLGRQVHQQKVIQGINEIHTTGLTSGLYHYVIVQDKGIISAGKMVIEY